MAEAESGGAACLVEAPGPLSAQTPLAWFCRSSMHDDFQPMPRWTNRAKRLLETQPENGKKARVSYTAKELAQWVKGVDATSTPHPDVLVDMWLQSGGDHVGFMARYAKYCEFYKNQLREDDRIAAEQQQLEKAHRLNERQVEEELRLKALRMEREFTFKADELRAKERHMQEALKLKADELRLKERQVLEEIKLNLAQAMEQRDLTELRLRDELKRQDKKIEAEIKLLDQQTRTAAAHTCTAEKEAQSAEIKCFRLSHQKGALCDSDRRSVLHRKFPTVVAGLCDELGCDTFVCAFKCIIAELPGYAMGEVEKLQVLCNEHAKGRPKVHAVDLDRYKLGTWVHRVGGASHTTCGLCGKCELAVWCTETHVCHVNPRALGGRADHENLVIGSAGCNQQQGQKTLEDFQEQIRVTPIAKQVCVPEDKVGAVLDELLRRDKKGCLKCPLARMQAILATQDQPLRAQQSIKRMLGN